MDYLSELTRIVHEHVPAPVYPDPVPRLSAEIAAKRAEIANLREHRPESKREYLDGLERLGSELADLIVQDNQICDDNAAARSAADADYLAAIETAKQDPDNQWAAIRIVRNRLLAECDWTQIPDAPLTEEQKEAWREYRQALRDIPQTFAPRPYAEELALCQRYCLSIPTIATTGLLCYPVNKDNLRVTSTGSLLLNAEI